MATTTAVKFIKQAYIDIAEAKTAATNGAIVFDQTHKIICVDGQAYGGAIQDATYSNNILTIVKGDGSENITLNFSDIASASGTMAVFNQIKNTIIGALNSSPAYPTGDDIDPDVRTAFTNNAIVGDTYTESPSGVYTITAYGDTRSAAINKVDNKLAVLANEVVSSERVVAQALVNIKTAVGLDSNAAYVAPSNTTYLGSATSVQDADARLDAAIKAVSDRVDDMGTYDTIICSNAADTPAGITWTSGGTTVTGTLAAAKSTMHKIYLVPMNVEGTDAYAEYITVKSGTGAGASYRWEKIGTTAADIVGYAKTVTVNGKQYAVTGNGTDVNIGNVVTAVSGTSTGGLGNTAFVGIQASAADQPDSTTGTYTVSLTPSVKVQEISSASSGSQGLLEASDAKSYIDTKTAVENKAATITVNDSTATEIATVGGTSITASAVLYWDTYEAQNS